MRHACQRLRGSPADSRCRRQIRDMDSCLMCEMSSNRLFPHTKEKSASLSGVSKSGNASENRAMRSGVQETNALPSSSQTNQENTPENLKLLTCDDKAKQSLVDCTNSHEPYRSPRSTRGAINFSIDPRGNLPRLNLRRRSDLSGHQLAARPGLPRIAALFDSRRAASRCSA